MAREMERKLAVMAAKEEKHAQLMAKVNAEREKVSRKTVSFTVDGADDPIGIPPPRAAELCPCAGCRRQSPARPPLPCATQCPPIAPCSPEGSKMDG